MNDRPGKLEGKDYLHSTVKALATLAPGIGEAQTYLDDLRRKRFNRMIKQLENRQVKLTEEMLESHDLLHGIVVTMEAVVRTRREKKIDYLANLLAGFLDEDDWDQYADQHGELTDILASLTFEELYILTVLDKYYPTDDYSEDVDLNEYDVNYMSDYKNELTAALEISRPELQAKLHRIERSGCIRAQGQNITPVTYFPSALWGALKQRAEIVQEDVEVNM